MLRWMHRRNMAMSSSESTKGRLRSLRGVLSPSQRGELGLRIVVVISSRLHEKRVGHAHRGLALDRLDELEGLVQERLLAFDGEHNRALRSTNPAGSHVGSSDSGEP